MCWGSQGALLSAICLHADWMSYCIVMSSAPPMSCCTPVDGCARLPLPTYINMSQANCNPACSADPGAILVTPFVQE